MAVTSRKGFLDVFSLSKLGIFLRDRPPIWVVWQCVHPKYWCRVAKNGDTWIQRRPDIKTHAPTKSGQILRSAKCVSIMCKAGMVITKVIIMIIMVITITLMMTMMMSVAAAKAEVTQIGCRVLEPGTPLRPATHQLHHHHHHHHRRYHYH